MHETIFLQDMAIVMTVGAVITILCQRFHLPVVLGYILAGAVIGPNTPPFPLVKDIHSIQILSELGVIFLLFSIGLEFNLTRLARVGFVAVFAATLEIVIMIWIGYSLGRAFGWNFMNSLFLGAILSISSTTIIAKILLETNRIKEKFAQVILGILVIEDLLAIIIIALLSGIASTGSLELREVGAATVRVTAFIAVILAGGFLLVPRLLGYIARFKSGEMLVVTVLGLCFGASFLAAKFGFSVALGAFLIGAVIAETKQVHETVQRIEPIRDMFTAIFFVSVGMLLDPKTVAIFGWPILVITVVTIVGKVFSCSLGAFLAGYKSDTALRVGLGLAQIGEFSFIIARLGESTNVTSPFLYPIAVAVSSITTLTTPFLMHHTGGIIGFIKKLAPQPLATLFGLYTGWLEKIGTERSERRKDLIWKGLGGHLLRLAFYAALALILFYGASQFQQKFQLFPLQVYWAVLGIAAFPVLIGIAYTIDKMIWDVVFLRARSRNKTDEAPDVNQTFHNAVRFLTVLVVGLVFLAVGSSFLPRLPLFTAVCGLVVISGVFLWGSMRKLHEQIEKTVIDIFGQEKTKEEPAIPRSTHDDLIRLIHEEYPLEAQTQDFLLPYQETGVNRPVRDLRLRSETGATIVAIYRDDESIPNPPPETRLLPGDVLLLMGDHEQIAKAVRFLNSKIKEPPAVPVKNEHLPATQSFRVPAGSSLVGRTLGELRLRRRTGATVLGLQKADISSNNPSPEIVLEPEDVLIVFGMPDQLEAAAKYLSSGGA